MNDTTLFAFESDFVATLRCVPMAVRFKLDHCGVKLTLRQWSRLRPEERRALLMLPCHSPDEVEAYRTRLVQLVIQRSGEAPRPLPDKVDPLWEAASTPDAVRAFAASVSVAAPSAEEWGDLTPLRRFALIKLSRDNHDNVNFIPALREFGLLETGARPAGAPRVAVVR